MNRTLFLGAGLGVLACFSASAQSTLVGIDTSGASLYEIDINTGVRTLIAALGATPGTVGALAYDEVAGVMYMSSTSLDSLFTLDLNTLTVTLVGPYNIGATVVMHGLEDDPATGRLYGHSSRLAGGLTSSRSTS